MMLGGVSQHSMLDHGPVLVHLIAHSQLNERLEGGPSPHVQLKFGSPTAVPTSWLAGLLVCCCVCCFAAWSSQPSATVNDFLSLSFVSATRHGSTAKICQADKLINV